MENTERLKLEMKALRHVFALPTIEDRQDAADKMPAIELPGLWDAVVRAMRATPGIELQDVAAMLEKRPVLQREADAIHRAGAADYLDSTKGQDPQEMADAYILALEDTARAGNQRIIDETIKKLERAKDAPTPECKEIMRAVSHALTRSERVLDESLTDVWNLHLDRLQGTAVKPHEAVLLNHKRGEWANWFNAHLGPRGGLEPGRTLIIGGGPAGGKTSLASALAVDALEANCPVLYWQLELSREETLEHLMAQYPTPNWWKEPFWKRCRRALPEDWGTLLTLPRFPEPDGESLERALTAQARKAERDRRVGIVHHDVNGVVILDYTQLLTLLGKGPKDAGHEVLTTAVSRLAKTAGETGAVLVLLSQMTKEAQKDAKSMSGTSYHGADLARVAHCAVNICRACKNKDKDKTKGELRPADAHEEVHIDPSKGEARLLSWAKTRGVLHGGENGDKRPDPEHTIWYKNRALHGGNMSTTSSGMENIR